MTIAKLEGEGFSPSLYDTWCLLSVIKGKRRRETFGGILPETLFGKNVTVESTQVLPEAQNPTSD
jgi:hypothetical protein